MKKLFLLISFSFLFITFSFCQKEVTISIHDIEMERLHDMEPELIVIKEVKLPKSEYKYVPVRRFNKKRLEKAMENINSIRFSNKSKKFSEFLSSGHATGSNIKLSIPGKGEFILHNSKFKMDKSGWILFFDEADSLFGKR